MLPQLSSSLYLLPPVTHANTALIKRLERSGMLTHAKTVVTPQRESEHLI